MAEFQEVIKQYKRMCKSTQCCKCDIYHSCGENLSRCPLFIYDNPQKVEEIIMRWAAEHPESVYPTWYAWLKDMGVTFHDAESSWIGFTERIHHPIPVDIADKLGLDPLDPKEGY